MTPRTTRPGAALPGLIAAPPPRSRQRGPDTLAAVRCYYAGDPARRPHCALTAEIALGPVALCGPCAAARSTLGKGTVPAALPPGPAIDVLDWVDAADAAVRQASRDLAAAVTRARSRGRTWTQIAGRLGITRQAAQQRFSREPGPHALPGPPPVTANRR